jgi:hypothetical protein
MSEVEMTDVDDDCDSQSKSSGAELSPQQLNDEVRQQEETTIDLSRDGVSRDDEELHVEALVASSTPRAYQLEMLEESLQHNIIVAVSVSLQKAYTPVALGLTCSRWTRAAARRILSAESFLYSLTRY